MMPSSSRSIAIAAFAAGLAGLSAIPAWAEPPRKPSCQPVSERTKEVGCWIIATQPLEALPQAPLYWHLYTYSDVASAKAARRGHETVTESLGKVWLMDVAPAGWKPAGGQRVAMIGPLAVQAATKLVAEYMEAVFPPGFVSPVHRHPGPEAWYTTTGEVCLETPEGKSVGRAGETKGVIVAGGLAMRLSVTGSELRRSLVLILHDASKPHTVLTKDWTPKGLCAM